MRYKAEIYQQAAIRFICDHPHCGIFADPGAGKTAATLAAIKLLQSAGHVRRVLLVAPRLVCHNVWPAETAKWDQFAGMSSVVLHGDDKAQRLFQMVVDPAAAPDITLVNPEAVEYLLSFFPERWFSRANPMPWPWDTLVIDESSKFKNPSALRFKALKKYHRLFRRRVLLTGTPAPNGLHDLWSQIYLLDSGETLGKNISEYRRRYFSNSAPPGVRFQRWEPVRGADVQINSAIAPFVLRIDAEQFPDLPEILFNDISVTLPDRAMAVYKSMESQMFAELDNGDQVLAMSGAGKYSTCRQMAGGRFYDGEGVPQKLHSEKIDAVENLADELQGKPLLVAYYYRHDLDALRERFPDVPNIGGDTSTERTNALLSAWNAGQLPLLAVHPDSMAHGLNMQSGGNDVCFLTIPNNLENYIQLIKRLHRRGVRGCVRVHRLVAKNTIDEAVVKALGKKEKIQQNLLDAIKNYRMKT
jgi:SNF2 family DNA or RNA helicase